jgi:hypothetical protein
MRRKIVVSFLTLWFISSLAFAETVVLKSGESIEGVDGRIPTSLSVTKENLPEPADKTGIVKEIIELSGGKIAIENLPAGVKSGAAVWKDKLPPHKFEILNGIIDESYKPEGMYQDVLDYLVSRFDEKHYAAFLNWLHSPLSRNMTKLEENASNSGALQEMKEFAAKFQQSPPPQERVALARELDEAVSATQYTIEMVTINTLEMFKALESVMPEQQGIKGDNWEEGFKSNLKAQLEQSTEQNVLIYFLYTYRSVPDGELKEYIKFWESDEGHWCTKVMNQAYLDALAKAGKKMGNGFANVFSNAK